MERLTQRLRTGEVLMASEYEEKYTEQEWISVLQDRLAAYEDTHMTPSDVTSMRMDMAIIAALFGGVNVDRMKELTEADKAGRLVVLPCKPGDLLWTFSSYPVGQVYSFQVCSFTVTDIRTPNGRTMMNTSRCGVIDALAVGKTVFLTREEAEKALGAMKDE